MKLWSSGCIAQISYHMEEVNLPHIRQRPLCVGIEGGELSLITASQAEPGATPIRRGLRIIIPAQQNKIAKWRLG